MRRDTALVHIIAHTYSPYILQHVMRKRVCADMRRLSARLLHVLPTHKTTNHEIEQARKHVIKLSHI